MAPRSKKHRPARTPNTPLGRYAARSQQPLTALAFVAPLIVAFELGGLWTQSTGADLLSRMQIGQFLRQLGATRWFLPPLLVAVVLLSWHAALGLKWRVRPGVLLLMAGESVLWALPLLAMSYLQVRTWGASDGSLGAAATPMGELGQYLLAGIGAGIYEEFLFRLVGLNLCALLLLDIAELPEPLGYGAAVAICSTLFGLYHFVGPMAFSWPRMIFLTLAGGYLSIVYMLRGYGLSVGAHAVYNVLIAVLLSV